MKYVIEISDADRPLISWHQTAWGGNNKRDVLRRAKKIIASQSGLAKSIQKIRVVEVIEEHSRMV